MNKHVRWMVVGLMGLMPVMALAEGPTSRPARGRKMQAERWRALHDDPVDLEKVQAFVRENSPNRWKAFQSLPEGKREELRDRMGFFYRAVHALLRENDPFIVSNRKQQIRLEDEMFELRLRISADGAKPADVKENKKILREKVQRLVQLRMEERTHRLERLKVAVEDETKRLETDRANIDGLVEQRFQAELAAGPAADQPRPGKPARDKDASNR